MTFDASINVRSNFLSFYLVIQSRLFWYTRSRIINVIIIIKLSLIKRLNKTNLTRKRVTEKSKKKALRGVGLKTALEHLPAFE